MLVIWLFTSTMIVENVLVLFFVCVFSVLSYSGQNIVQKKQSISLIWRLFTTSCRSDKSYQNWSPVSQLTLWFVWNEYDRSFFFPLLISDQTYLVSQLITIISGMDGIMVEEEDDCPELVPIDNPPCPPAQQIPVTIITGYLGERPILLTQA